MTNEVTRRTWMKWMISLPILSGIGHQDAVPAVFKAPALPAPGPPPLPQDAVAMIRIHGLDFGTLVFDNLELPPEAAIEDLDRGLAHIRQAFADRVRERRGLPDPDPPKEIDWSEMPIRGLTARDLLAEVKHPPGTRAPEWTG